MADATAGFLLIRGGASLRTSNGVSGEPDNVLLPSLYGIAWGGAFSGHYKLAGSCTLGGDPVGNRLVLVFPHGSPSCVAGAFVGTDGLFEFDGLAPGKYKVVGEDLSGETNGVIYAYVDAVPR